MPWPSIPRLIFTDDVDVRQVTSWSQDAAGGRVPTYGSWAGSQIVCSVSAANADDIMAHSRESQVVSHVVTTLERLGGIRDQLLWLETGATLTIISVEPAGDQWGRIWNHYCEEYTAR